MSSRFALLLAVLVLIGGVTATPASAQSDELSNFSFLRLESSARASALGGAFSSVYDGDVNGLFYNPALLDERTHRALSVSYTNHLADLNAGFAAYSYHLEDLGSFGAGLRYLSYGTLEGRDETGQRTSDFSAGDAALTLSYARSFSDRIRYGVSLHGIYSSISSYSASALAADLGALYRLPGPQLTLSASLHNVGWALDAYAEARNTLPTDLRLGVTKRLAHLPLALSVTGYRLQEVGGDVPAGTTSFDQVMRHVIVGGEFQFSEAFQVRLGYNHRRHQQLKTQERLDPAGFGAGFGLSIAGFTLDYAYSSWSELGGLHQLTVQTVL